MSLKEEKEQKMRELGKTDQKQGSKESNRLSLFGLDSIAQRKETYQSKRVGTKSIEDARRKSSLFQEPEAKLNLAALFTKFPVFKALCESNFQEKRKKDLFLEFLKK